MIANCQISLDSHNESIKRTSLQSYSISLADNSYQVMYRHFAFIFFLYCIASLNTLTAQYFQQKVAYDISASQDTSNHTIIATCDITYTNNSEVELDTIFLHLWANAFSDKLSAYSNQAIRAGNLDFYFSDEDEMGGYNNLMVNIAGNRITLYSWQKNPDVVYFLLPQSLKTKESLKINTTYELKLPRKLSRMGYNNFDNYLMYWYPTPAVFDAEGWHPMPYLSMGEMYTEVADYNIELSSPLRSLIASTLPNGNSKENLYRFEGKDMIDFAIVTSTNKNTTTHPITTKRGNSIDITVMTKFLKRDSSSVKYLQKAIDYFEPIIGDFPYSSISILDKGKKSTSGMEYPGLITVSGMDNEEGNFEYYLVHEILHQWFYSALAFNQRDYAWLDEGLTTYFQQRYYKKTKRVDHYSKKGALVMHEGQQPFLQTVARAQACRHYHVPLNTDVMNIDPTNYGFNAYEIPARMFAYLADYMGHTTFDAGIKEFYTLWKNKHPGPNDLKNVLEKVSSKDLSWFFEDLVKKDWSYDYAIKSLEDGNLEVTHLSGSTPPYKITLKSDDNESKVMWIDGHQGTKSINIADDQYNKVIIDEEALSMDINRNNNSINVRRPIKLIPGVKLDDGRYRELYFLPTIAYNTSDGTQLGMAFYNSSFPGKNLKWVLSPAYGFGSSAPVGEGWISYDHYLKNSKFRKLQYKLNAKSYSYFNNESLGTPLRYFRISPHISLHFNHDAKKHKYSKAYIKSIFISEEKFLFDEDVFTIENNQSTILRVGYELYNFWELGPSDLIAQLEYQPYTNDVNEKHHYLKLTASYSKSFKYAPKKSIDFRIWGAYFISNSQRDSPNYDASFVRGTSALIYQGFNDYAYDGYFFNRANQNASLDNQIGYEGGGFKTPFGSQYSIGQTNDLAFAINIKSNLPIKTPRLFPLKLFLDVGYYTSKETTEAKLEGKSFYSAGVMLEYGEGLFSVYLPLVNSQAINDIYNTEGIGILGKISFRIDLIRFNPWDIAEDYSF